MYDTWHGREPSSFHCIQNFFKNYEKCHTKLSPKIYLKGPHVDSAANDHLHKLSSGDGHGDERRHSNSHCSQCVIRVHDRVDRIVHGYVISSRRCEWQGHSVPDIIRNEIVRNEFLFWNVNLPGRDEDCSMVVPMQKNERALSKDYENGIAQFRDFW